MRASGPASGQASHCPRKGARWLGSLSWTRIPGRARWRFSMSSWADDADDDQGPDFKAAPPPVKSKWGSVQPVQPVGLVFEDFEVRNAHKPAFPKSRHSTAPEQRPQCLRSAGSGVGLHPRVVPWCPRPVLWNGPRARRGSRGEGMTVTLTAWPFACFECRAQLLLLQARAARQMTKVRAAAVIAGVSLCCAVSLLLL